MTPAVIVETGFMTSPTDRAIIVSKPGVAAKGIADGVLSPSLIYCRFTL